MVSFNEIKKSAEARRETVPCKWCGKPTPMLGTKECDAHWELRSRLEADPGMARKMLKELDL